MGTVANASVIFVLEYMRLALCLQSKREQNKH